MLGVVLNKRGKLHKYIVVPCFPPMHARTHTDKYNKYTCIYNKYTYIYNKYTYKYIIIYQRHTLTRKTVFYYFVVYSVFHCQSVGVYAYIDPFVEPHVQIRFQFDPKPESDAVKTNIVITLTNNLHLNPGR